MLKFIAKIVAKFRHYASEEEHRLWTLEHAAEAKALEDAIKVKGLFHHGEEGVLGEAAKVEKVADSEVGKVEKAASDVHNDLK